MADKPKWHKRTHTCGELRSSHQGQEIVLTGWVYRRRDHGGLIFIDIRDRYGLTQVVFNPETAKETHEKAQKLRSEFVISVQGKVQVRPKGTANAGLATGEIEVQATGLDIINEAKTPPFVIEDTVGSEVSEETRLKYRYLDLRRPRMQRNLIRRHQVLLAVREFLDQDGFVEVETPLLMKSTPEGARDYIVPSRLNPGEFFVLPQSPQTLKQILMVSGMDKYFQIARCLRDEDLRADRQPEFTQIDMEMSFISEDDIIAVSERMMKHIFKKTLGLDIPIPFPRLCYSEAMGRFGSDKPDTRFGLELKDVSEIVAVTEFKVFKDAVQKGGQVKAITIPGGAGFTPGQVDQLKDIAVEFGAKGLASIKVKPEGPESPIAKYLGNEAIQKIVEKTEAKTGDLIVFVADQPDVVAEALNRIRMYLGEKLGLIKEGLLNFVWIADFPMFQWNGEDKKWDAVHHPFTSPKFEDLPLLNTDPGKVKARAYDLVLNGFELGGGSIRIHDPKVQEQVFEAIGLTREQARERFGFLLEAFEFGAPPHGGVAFGVDRLIMIMLGEKNIREVIAFPKTQKATCPLTGAPSQVSEKQLKELHIKVVE